MPFLRVVFKRSREKSNRKKQRNSNTLMWQKTVYLKILFQKIFEITTRSSLASLTAWNSSLCWRFLAYLIVLWQLQKYEKWGHQLRVQESHTLNSSFDPSRSPYMIGPVIWQVNELGYHNLSTAVQMLCWGASERHWYNMEEPYPAGTT